MFGLFARKTLSLGLLAAALSTTAMAKSTGYYQATLSPENKHLGKWNNVVMALGGWRCYGTNTITFTEVLSDHKGVPKEITQNADSDFNFSLFSMNQPVSSNFVRNMDLGSPRLIVAVTENCSKDEVYAAQEPDGQGGWRTVMKTDTKRAWMKWKCDTRALPERQGQTINTSCVPADSSYGDFSLESLLMPLFREKTFNLSLSLQRVEEVFVKDLCGSDRSNRVIVKLQQGVGGHVGEDDFVVHVKLDGKETIDIPTAHGLLNDEISYCPSQKNSMSVEISATEVDLFFDDEYAAEKVLNFDLTKRGTQGAVQVERSADDTQRIQLKRRTYFGEVFTDTTSEVIVSVMKVGR